MAGKKKSTTPKKAMIMGNWQLSWKGLFVAASVTVNIAFVVIFITMMTSHTFDGMFIREGLTRYCASDNNDKFESSSNNVTSLREFTCASGDAKQYFDEGLQKYLDSKATKE